MIKRVLQITPYREPSAVEVRHRSCKKNTLEPAEESVFAIRPARSSRKDAVEWIASAVNLGGIAEVLPFVPYVWAKGFLFFPFTV